MTECSLLPSNYEDSWAVPTDIPQCAVTLMFAQGNLKGVNGRCPVTYTNIAAYGCKGTRPLEFTATLFISNGEMIALARIGNHKDP